MNDGFEDVLSWVEDISVMLGNQTDFLDNYVVLRLAFCDKQIALRCN